MAQSSALDDFLFDLNGYLILKNAVEPDLLAALNEAFDQFPQDLELGDWYRNSQRRDYHKAAGFELHNCVEIGAPFEALIDHPSWIDHLRHYCGEEQSYVEGLFIDEYVAAVRRGGGHFPAHSGGYHGAMRGAYGYANGVFRCGQCNIILALTDIGPGDGATMVVPRSHKSNFPHPNVGDYDRGDRMDNLEGAIPLFLKKGDALLFVDGLTHGSISRTNQENERRTVLYRYGPTWGTSAFGYSPSPELLDRLTPARRRIVQPIRPIAYGSRTIASHSY